MKEADAGKSGLAGKVLAASPALMDPNFHETLVYVAQHDAEGAMGLVLNRPLGRTLGQVLLHEKLSDAVAEVPLYYGGPVRPGNLVVALFRKGDSDQEVFCQLDTSMEQVEAHVKNNTGWVRVFAGYAGWGEGQLESELAEQAWRVCLPDPILFHPEAASGLWSLFLSGDTRWRKLLRFLPKDPRLN